MRYIICILLVIPLLTCKRKSDLVDKGPIVCYVKKVDDEFSFYLYYFSLHYNFQLDRARFPISKTIYKENDKGIAYSVTSSNYPQLDFRERDTTIWKKHVSEEGYRARVRMSGVSNGRELNFYFEKENKKWMLLGWDERFHEPIQKAVLHF